MSAVEKPAEPVDHINIRKWGAPLMKAGWTTIPNAFFEYQQALGLEPLDVEHPAAHRIALVETRREALALQKSHCIGDRRPPENGSAAHRHDGKGRLHQARAASR